MRKNKFIIKILIKIVIALALVLLGVTVIYFLNKQINKINRSFNEKKTMDYFIENREMVNDKIKTDFLEVDPDYQKKIDEAIPSVYNVLSFVDAMESLAKKYSFEQTLSFDQPIPESSLNNPIPLTIVKFNLIINQANIDNFANYLQDFEKLPYFASINNINYLGASDGGWKNNSTINITGSFYAHQ